MGKIGFTGLAARGSRIGNPTASAHVVVVHGKEGCHVGVARVPIGNGAMRDRAAQIGSRSIDGREHGASRSKRSHREKGYG